MNIHYRVRCDLDIEAADEREARAIAATALRSSTLFAGEPCYIPYCAGTVTVELLSPRPQGTRDCPLSDIHGELKPGGHCPECGEPTPRPQGGAK